MNADQLAELEDERRFLLRSLRDLDAELAAGDVDPVDYETLRDGYTKRAADVLRGIEDGKAALPSRRPRAGRGGARVVAGRLAVAAGVGILAARSSGERTAGDTITGGVPGREDTAALLSQARGLLGGDPRLAQDAYARCSTREPDNAEALTYSAWLLYFASAGASADCATWRWPRRRSDSPGPSRSTRRTPTRTASWPSSPPTPTPTWRRPAPRPMCAWRRPPARSASSSRACSTPGRHAAAGVGPRLSGAAAPGRRRSPACLAGRARCGGPSTPHGAGPGRPSTMPRMLGATIIPRLSA